MTWDDLRYVLALAKAGSLAKAARALKVDHTTVGRRIEALEHDLGLTLFTRTPAGYVLTQDAQRLLPEIEQVEAAVLQLERCAASGKTSLDGVLRVTSSETFGSAYLAPRLMSFQREHPGLAIELVLGPAVFDLGRREADVAVRLFRSEHEGLVMSKAGEVAHALYATPECLERLGPPRKPADLARFKLFMPELFLDRREVDWLRRLCPEAKIALTCNLTFAIVSATLTSQGVGLLPRYLGDAEPRLRRVPMPDEPRQPIWLTVHKDLRNARRVRVILDFLRATLDADQGLLAGAVP